MAIENRNPVDEERFYIFDKLPENIRQMGEQPENGRIYVEDYVVTYMHRIFREKAENSLVVFVGKRGEGPAQGSVFLYGAIEVQLDILLWKEQFTAQVWDKIHQQVHEYFSGGEVLGWGCGVHMGNSQIKKAVAGIQRKHFSREGQILFFWDYSEEEESVCRWVQGGVQTVSGYLIYYGKNPQMQEYMLRGKKKESFESDYQDTVMENVRTVIQKKERFKQQKKPALFVAGGMLLVLTALGGLLLVQSNQKIQSLETAILTLSQEPAASKSPAASPGASSPPKSTSSLEPSTSKVPPASQGPSPSKAPAASRNLTVPKTSAAPLQQAPSKAPAATKAPVVSKAPAGTSSPQGKKPAEGKRGVAAGIPGRNSYVVQQGDTLSQIVWRQYHTMKYLGRVKRANRIKNEDEIYVGQRIVLPLYKK